jgi:arginine-tRNA-protein transferase
MKTLLEDQYISPDENGFKGTMLDQYLSKGYFRMLYQLFTTNSIPNGTYGKSTMMMPVFWLRTIVKKVQNSKSAINIWKKCGRFQVAIKKAEITNEVDALYALYHKQVEFDSADSCGEQLGCNPEESPFDGLMVEVRDGEKLIAVGYFDKGENAIMGILNVYHPDYKQFSLGKFLMLQKIDFALANHFDYYYTGYIGTEVDTFDYKSFPDINAVEVLLPVEQEWKPFTEFDKNQLKKYFESNILGFDEGDFIN